MHSIVLVHVRVNTGQRHFASHLLCIEVGLLSALASSRGHLHMNNLRTLSQCWIFAKIIRFLTLSTFTTTRLFNNKQFGERFLVQYFLINTFVSQTYWITGTLQKFSTRLHPFYTRADFSRGRETSNSNVFDRAYLSCFDSLST